MAPWPSRATDVTNIARSLIPAPASGNSYWAETARGLFAGLLGYVLDSATMVGKRTIKSALKLFSRGQSLVAVMHQILAAEPHLNEFVKDKFRQHIGRDDKQRASFNSHITTALDGWNNSLVDAVTSKSDFSIADLRRRAVHAANRDADWQLRHGRSGRSFAGSTGPRRSAQRASWGRQPYKLLLMLDEFYQFGRMPKNVRRRSWRVMVFKSR